MNRVPHYLFFILFTIIVYKTFYVRKSTNYYIQNYPSKLHNTIPVDSLLEDVVKEFNYHCHLYGITPKRIMYLDSIVIKNDNDDIFGCLNLEVKNDSLFGKIEIQPKALFDSISIRWVVYHELAHWYGLEHSNGIMEDGYTKEISTIVKTYEWDLLVYDLFSKLRANQGLAPAPYKGKRK